jgi:predicted nuclease of restriction endonuclease-like (RecB) superfamily
MNSSKDNFKISDYLSLVFVQQVAAQIPWGHNILLLNKLNSNSSREFYAKKVIENGWSRNILLIQIETDLHSRDGLCPRNWFLGCLL